MLRIARNKDLSFPSDIEGETIKNTDYRRVLFTAKHSQLVLMSLKPGEEIGMETHDLDQFFRFEDGKGAVIVNGHRHEVSDGDSIVIPQGCRHNVINTSESEDLKLYSIYSPPNHKRGTIHRTKADAREEHFDGETDV
jgi:mannose-6-phosphate isomerase-like protein (cupin superfamily)